MLQECGGFEGATLHHDGFTSAAGAPAPTNTGRVDADGAGGDWSLPGPAAGTDIVSHGIRSTSAEVRFGFGYTHDAAAAGTYAALYWSAAGTREGHVRLRADGYIEIRQGAGAGTVRATSAAAVLTTEHYVEVRVCELSSTDLEVRVYMDDDHVTPVVTYTSATSSTATNPASLIDGFGFELTNPAARVDDWYYSTLTLETTGGLGTIAANTTITGGTSGATAKVVRNDAGVLTLRQWSGIPFQNGEVVTQSGAALVFATVVAPRSTYVSGFQPGSTFLGNVYYTEHVATGNGTHSDLLGSDLDSVDNYLQIDEAPPASDGDYNEGALVGDKDSYGWAGTALEDIRAVTVTARALHGGAATVKGRPFLLSAGIEYTGAEYTTGTSYTRIYEVWPERPWGASPGAWDAAEVSAAEFGYEVRGT